MVRITVLGALGLLWSALATDLSVGSVVVVGGFFSEQPSATLFESLSAFTPEGPRPWGDLDVAAPRQ